MTITAAELTRVELGNKTIPVCGIWRSTIACMLAKWPAGKRGWDPSVWGTVCVMDPLQVSSYPLHLSVITRAWCTRTASEPLCTGHEWQQLSGARKEIWKSNQQQVSAVSESRCGPGLLVPAFLLGQTTAETLSRESISIGEQSHRYVLKKYEAAKSWLVSPDASPRANRDLRMPNIMFQMGFFFLPSPLCVQLRPVFLPPLLFGTYGCPHFNSKRWN